MPWRLQPFTLSGTHVVLEPLSQRHCNDLSEAAMDGELWRLWYTAVAHPKDMTSDIDKRLSRQAAGDMLPFAVIDRSTGKAVGSTTYLNMDGDTRRLEIGSTWYRKSVQRSPVNTECKLLLLTNAFEQLNCVAVEFRTNFMNHQSRRAIERLGAKFDGTLRSHSINKNGTLRDTCVYSIITGEWPTVKAHLAYRLENRSAD